MESCNLRFTLRSLQVTLSLAILLWVGTVSTSGVSMGTSHHVPNMLELYAWSWRSISWCLATETDTKLPTPLYGVHCPRILNTPHYFFTTYILSANGKNINSQLLTPDVTVIRQTRSFIAQQKKRRKTETRPGKCRSLMCQDLKSVGIEKQFWALLATAAAHRCLHLTDNVLLPISVP